MQQPDAERSALAANALKCVAPQGDQRKKRDSFVKFDEFRKNVGYLSREDTGEDETFL